MIRQLWIKPFFSATTWTSSHQKEQKNSQTNGQFETGSQQEGRQRRLKSASPNAPGPAFQPRAAVPIAPEPRFYRKQPGQGVTRLLHLPSSSSLPQVRFGEVGGRVTSSPRPLRRHFHWTPRDAHEHLTTQKHFFGNPSPQTPPSTTTTNMASGSWSTGPCGWCSRDCAALRGPADQYRTNSSEDSRQVPHHVGQCVQCLGR